MLLSCRPGNINAHLVNHDDLYDDDEEEEEDNEEYDDEHEDSDDAGQGT